MSSKRKALATPHLSPANQESLPTLISQLRGLIESVRGQALRAVDSIQVHTCWEIGRHIVEFEQQGAGRAEYGTRLLPRLAKSLTTEFGRGFDTSNLRYMRLFYLAFPIRDALRHELSWTHYRKFTLRQLIGSTLFLASGSVITAVIWLLLNGKFGMTKLEVLR